MQLSLLDQLKPGPDAGFAQARRRDLGAGAWVESVPDWLGRPSELFELLLITASWEKYQRQMYDRILDVPRLVAGMPGQEALRLPGEVTTHVQPRCATSEQLRRVVAQLHAMSQLLSARYAKNLCRVSLAYYRDGNDSVAFHGDKLGVLRSDTVVAIVSVGERRKFLLRPALALAQARGAGKPVAPAGGAKRGATLSLSVGEGDLLVMGGSCQETWEHAVPKATRAGPRIAVMFREPMPGPDVKAAGLAMPTSVSAPARAARSAGG